MPVSTRMRSSSISSSKAAQESAENVQLTWFLISAWNSYDSSMPISSWARSEARRFYHDVNKTVKFATVYDTLMEFAKGMCEKQTVVSDSVKSDSSLASLFVADGEMTKAEEKMGRAKLNSILFREYALWWDAFVEEVAEDVKGAASATDRFSYHCARIISRKTGLRDDVVAPVVGAWLIEKGAVAA